MKENTMSCKGYFVFLALVLFSMTSGCGGSGGGGTGHYGAPNSDVHKVTATEEKVLKSSNGFGFNLFKSVVASDKDKNVFISPLSVSMALGMVYNGANGDTQQQMQTVLQLNGLTLQQVNESYKSLIALLGNLDPKVKFSLANSIWYRQGFAVEKEYINLNTKYFDARVKALNFNDPGAADTINKWVNNETNGKITSIVNPPVPDDVVMYLINAIYFKGNWSLEFDKADTQDDLFTVPDGSKKTCSMMYKKDDFDYLENTDFQAIDLPYGAGDYSMTVFLPKPEKEIDSLIADFSQDKWDGWMQLFAKKEVILYLPKFKIKYEKNLNDILIALGMQDAFDPLKADFTNINKNGELFISEVKHKSFVEVNEQGTEAAAATSATATATSMPPPPPIMKINRPFIFAIREKQSGTILFMGKITDPTLE